MVWAFCWGIAWWRLLTRQAVTSERKLYIGALATLLLALGLTGLGLITTRWNVKLPQLEPVIETIAQLSRFASPLWVRRIPIDWQQPQ